MVKLIKYKIVKYLRKVLLIEEPFSSHYMNRNPLYKQHSIGDYSYGRPMILFEDSGFNLKIGKFCSFAKDVTIFLGGNHRTDWVSTFPFNVLNEDFPNAVDIAGHPCSKGDVVIGNDVWVADSVKILSGVTIGDGAVVGAGAVVTRNIGPYEIWAGNPARLIKKRFDDEVITELVALAWWNWDIEQINTHVRTIQSNNIVELINIKK